MVHEHHGRDDKELRLQTMFYGRWKNEFEIKGKYIMR